MSWADDLHGVRARFTGPGLVEPREAIAVSGLEFLRRLQSGQFPSPPFAGEMDIYPITIESGFIVFQAIPSLRYYNPLGIVHGGYLATLLDTALGCAVHSVLAAGEAFSTIEMSIRFIRPVTEATGHIRADGRLVNRSRNIAVAEGRILSEDGKVIAHGAETCQIREASP